MTTSQEKLVAEFYKKFTDEVDAENDYYDAQFTEGRPHKVVDFLLQALRDQATEIHARVDEGVGELKCKYDCDGENGIGYHTKECDIEFAVGNNSARQKALSIIGEYTGQPTSQE